MEENYAQSLKEVVDVLQVLDAEYLKKIPSSFMSFINNNCDRNYNKKIDFYNDEWINSLSNDAKVLLAIVFKKYLFDINKVKEKTLTVNINKEDNSLEQTEEKVENKEEISYSNANLQKFNNDINFEDSSIVTLSDLSTKRTIEEEDIDYEPEDHELENNREQMEKMIPKFEDEVIPPKNDFSQTTSTALVPVQKDSIWQKLKRILKFKK